MNLTSEEIQLILETIRKAHGPGYSSDPKVSALQRKLSILLEMANRREGK